MTLSLGDRAAGCLLGLALGDALGFVVEGALPAEAAEYVRNELQAGRAGGRGRPPFPPGQYSDDTQLARELLLSIRDAGGVDPAAFGRRLVRLLERGALVGAGPGSRGAAERLSAGTAWQHAGAPPPYAGNGAAMRVGPLGVLYGGDRALLSAVARDQALVTHRDPRAVAGAVVIAGAVAIGARVGRLVPGEAIAELAEWARPIDRSVSEAIGAVAAWLAMGPAEAAVQASALAEPAPRGETPTLDWGGGLTPYVTASVAWSVYAFFRSPDDYWETICTAIAVGGDTDTLAAMAGAMAGARLGPGALPGLLLDGLTDAGSWTAPELARLARECATLPLARE